MLGTASPIADVGEYPFKLHSLKHFPNQTRNKIVYWSKSGLYRVLEGLNNIPASIKYYKEILQKDATDIEAIACIAVNHFYNDQPEVALRFYRSDPFAIFTTERAIFSYSGVMKKIFVCEWVLTAIHSNAQINFNYILNSFFSAKSRLSLLIGQIA